MMTHINIIKGKSVRLDLETDKKAEIRPLNHKQTILAFGLPALMMVVSFHWFMPWLQSIGLTPFEGMVVAHTVPMALLLTAVLENMVGANILCNWRVVVLYAIMLFFNIVAEELWWRGYILPRQEVAHGRFVF